MTYQLIETKTLGSAQASIEFTSIPQDGTDLLVLASCRATSTGTSYLITNPNSANASFRMLRGTGSGVFSQTDAISPYAEIPNADFTSNTFANISIYFPNYASTTTNKSFSIDSVTENNATASQQLIGAALYASNTAITSILLSAGDANLNKNRNFDVGTTISLYKITRGSSNGVVVS